MRKPFAKIISYIFFNAIFTIAIQAYESQITLEELTRGSDLILVGKVISVKKIGKEEVAKVEVLKKLKGDSSNEVFLSVSKTWACDVSKAIEGETALFFLGKYQIRPIWMRNLDETCE
jgi:hypothetical protein